MSCLRATEGEEAFNLAYQAHQAILLLGPFVRIMVVSYVRRVFPVLKLTSCVPCHRASGVVFEMIIVHRRMLSSGTNRMKGESTATLRDPFQFVASANLLRITFEVWR